jgi:Nitroreductase family
MRWHPLLFLSLRTELDSGFQLYNALGIERGNKAGHAKRALENYNFFGAPHVAIIHSDEALGTYGAVDCGGYVTSFMLAAQALGVATVPQAALAFHSDLVRQHFCLWRRPPRGLRNLVRLFRPRSQGQLLSHQSRVDRRGRALRRQLTNDSAAARAPHHDCSGKWNGSGYPVSHASISIAAVSAIARFAPRRRCFYLPKQSNFASVRPAVALVS